MGYYWFVTQTAIGFICITIWKMSSKLRIFSSLFLFMLFICYDSILTLYVQKYGNNDVIDKDKAIPRQRMNGKKQHLYKEMRAENQIKSKNKNPIYIACKY